jgi:hypothetical protein
VSHVFNEEEEEDDDDDDDDEEGEDVGPGPERVLQRTCSVAPRDPVRRSIEVERERERQREREIHRDRETERECVCERERQRERDRETERQRDRETETERPSCRRKFGAVSRCEKVHGGLNWQTVILDRDRQTSLSQ